MSNLSARSFAATDSDVVSITKQYLGALAGQNEARSTYLRALVGTLQAEFVSDLPVYRRTSPSEIVSAQLKALDQIHTRFYAIVMRTIIETPFDSDGRDKVKARHRRGVFARTSASALRVWLRSGKDVRSLDASKVNKGQLAIRKPAREEGKPVSAARRAITLSDQIADMAAEMAATDKEGATNVLEAVLSRITQSLLDLGNRASTKADVAMAGHRPFKTEEGLFWPVTLPKVVGVGVLREQRPAENTA